MNDFFPKMIEELRTLGFAVFGDDDLERMLLIREGVDVYEQDDLEYYNDCEADDYRDEGSEDG